MQKRLQNILTTLIKRHLLIVFIVVSYIGSLVWNFYLLRSIDRQYSDLIVRSVPVLSRLNNVTASAAYALHQTYPGLFNDQVLNFIEALQSARNALGDEMKSRLDFLNINALDDQTSDQTDLKTTGEDFSNIGYEVVRLYELHRSDEALSMRDQKFRPAFERYLTVTKRLADKVSRAGELSNIQLTAITKRNSLAVLSLGGWPLIAVFLATVLLLVISAVVAYLMPEHP